MLLGWLLTLYIGGSMPSPGELRIPLLVVHLGMLVAGLGAAVMVEYTGARWLTGRGSLGELRQVESRLAPLAWIGFVGMLLSGMFLAPDLSSPATAVKMLAVLAIGFNAVASIRLVHELRRLPADIPFSRLPPRLRAWCIANGGISQLSWWTAVLVGTIATAARAAQ